MLPRVMVLFVRKDLKRFGASSQTVVPQIDAGRSQSAADQHKRTPHRDRSADSLAPIAAALRSGRRSAPGVPLFDLCLLAPRETTISTVHAAARCLESFGWQTVALRAGPPAEAAHHQVDSIRVVERESRALLILAEEGRDLYDPWLTWYLGRCLASGRPAAILPLARNDATRRMWRLSGPVAPLPYCGYARAAGEQQYSLWIVPAGAAPESRAAENIDYWIARARLSR